MSINAHVYHTAKTNLNWMIARQSDLVAQRRIIDGNINGNYNSQFWDTPSQYDEKLDKSLRAEYAQLGVELLAINPQVKALSTCLKAASMLIVIVGINGTKADNDYEEVTRELNELLKQAGGAVSMTVTIGEKVNVLASQYDSARVYFTI